MERFYVEVLGLTVERRADQIGMVQLRAGAQLVDLVAVDGMLGKQGGAAPGRRRPQPRPLLPQPRRLRPRRPSIAHLRRTGSPSATAAVRYGAGGFGVSVYLTDPEGNGLELRG